MQDQSDIKILIIDFCNYEDYQIGGHLSLAKNLIAAFGKDLTLVGITTDGKDPVGRWFVKSIDGIDFNYFALSRYNKFRTKHIIPDRLACYLLLKRYRRKISKANIQNVFVQRHEIMLAVYNYKFKNVCYCFPGLENPLGISKYWFGKYLANIFDKIFFARLKDANLILAAGDNESIEEMLIRSKYIITRNLVHKFPIRINTGIFKPLNKNDVRAKLNIPASAFIVLTTGRLGWFKGWKFMIDSFIEFEKSVPNSLFYFIGEGEDHHKINEYLSLNQISEKVLLPGGKVSVEVSLYLNAADLFIMGSFKEGWSTSLSEAIACGVPSCVTNFSSAKEIIQEGRNGYVIDDRNVDLFVMGMLKAMRLSRPVYNENVKIYSTEKLKDDLLKLWQLI